MSAGIALAVVVSDLVPGEAQRMVPVLSERRCDVGLVKRRKASLHCVACFAAFCECFARKIVDGFAETRWHLTGQRRPVRAVFVQDLQRSWLTHRASLT